MRNLRNGIRMRHSNDFRNFWIYKGRQMSILTDQERRFSSEWFRQFGNHIHLPIEGSDRPHFAFTWFQLGEASALERAAVECERLSTAIDNAGKTYKRDTTSTHCALAIRALAQEVGK